jgi:hypothetical protein
MPKDERRSFSREFKLGVIERLEAGESGTALALEFFLNATAHHAVAGGAAPRLVFDQFKLATL